MPWDEALPGQERPPDAPSLGVSVLRVPVVLAGLRPVSDQQASRNGERSYRRFRGKGEKVGREYPDRGAQSGKGLVGAVGNAVALL